MKPVPNLAGDNSMAKAPRLYIGNLPYVAQKRDIEALFQQHNIEFKNIDISIDPFTGRNTSYCFVDFHHEETAQHVLETLQGHGLRGRPIKISSNTERRRTVQRRNTSSSSTDKTNTRAWKTQFGWRSPPPPATPPPPPPQPKSHNKRSGYVFDRWHRNDAHTHWTAPGKEGRRLFIGGLPCIRSRYALECEMKALFADFNLQAVSKLIYPYASRQPGIECTSGYYCFVDLAEAEEAEHAVELLDGMENRHGGNYVVQHTRNQNGGSKVIREQLGGIS